MVNKFAHSVIRLRWLIIIATLGIVGVAGSGVRLLQFDTDYRIFFSADNPQLLAFDELQNTYAKDDNLLFVFAPRDGQVFSREVLGLVKEVTEAGWRLPYVLRVDSVTNFQHTEAEGDDLIVADLVEQPDALSEPDLARIRDIAVNEPLMVNRLISPEADVTGVNITIQLPGLEPDKEVPRLVALAREMADGIRARYPEIEVHLTGVVMMNNAFPEASKNDMATLVPAMFGVVILVMILLLRSLWGTFATVLVIFFSVATGMGLAGWLGISLSGPSGASPTIILTMAVADCVHILATFLFFWRQKEGVDKHGALVESLRINLQPVFLTSLTTAIGFLSMNFSEVPPFRDLGNIVAMGVGAAFLWSVLFLPALMAVLPAPAKATATRTGRAMDRLGNFVVQRRNGLLWGMSALIIGLVAFIPNNELNDEFVKYFSQNVEFRRATDFTTDRLTGIYTAQYSLNSGSDNGVADPEFLRAVDAFAEWCRAQPEVIHVNTITDIFKRLNRNLHGDDPEWHRLPEERNLAAQYLLLYEMSLPYGLDLNNQINVDKSRTRFSVTLRDLSTQEFLAVLDRAREWLRANAPPGMQVEGASPTVMFSHIGSRNIKSMLWGSFLALGMISMILIVALRSLKVGLISLIPNLVPLGMGFGLWGIVDGRIGLALSVVSGMTLGIVVDDTVHFLSKYLRARREMGMDAEASVRYAFSTVGTALWVTSLVLIAGFIVLIFSDFKLNSGMGLLTAITIGMALVADFLFLPPLLMKMEPKQ